MAALVATINFGFTLLSGAVVSATATPMGPLQTTILLVEGLVFVSVLTTLYGHLVEGRALG